MVSYEENPRLDVFKSELVKNAIFSSNYEFPILKRSYAKPIKAIPFDKITKPIDYAQWVHFYIHDYCFERIWKNPKQYLNLLQKFDGAITPDFSLYRELPLAMQIWNTYRNRALAYWLQNNGINIVPNVRWGDERTYEFAFEGLWQGGTFAVGTNGCIQNKQDRYYFKKGLQKMVDVLKPDTIVNYHGIPMDIFETCKEKGIEVITLNYWRDALRKAAN